MSSFSTALSGLTAASTAVDSVSHDMANLNTTGYKKGNVSFQEMIAGASSMSTEGGGVAVSVNKNFGQGPIQPTNNPLDAAIQGNGFFVLRSGSGEGASSGEGEALLGRDGAFRIGSTGTLLTAAGDRVQGWTINTTTDAISTTGPVQDIIIPMGTTIPAEATTSFSIGANLDAAAADGTTMDVPLEVFDAQGGSHQFQVTFTKQTDDTWDIALNTADPDVVQPLPEFTPTSLSFVNGRLDPTTPAAVTIGPIDFTPESAIAALPQLTWNVFGADGTDSSLLTQESRPSVLTSVTPNGGSETTVADVRIGNGGKVLVRYSNGIESEFARLALSNVRNPDSLIAVGNSTYRAAEDSSVVPPAEAGADGNGDIAGGALELSNVNLAETLTQLITYQRTYQANARSITTSDELAQETLNLKR
jgi:flagellar hook protein FlgE